MNSRDEKLWVLAWIGLVLAWLVVLPMVAAQVYTRARPPRTMPWQMTAAGDGTYLLDRLHGRVWRFEPSLQPELGRFRAVEVQGIHAVTPEGPVAWTQGPPADPAQPETDVGSGPQATESEALSDEP